MLTDERTVQHSDFSAWRYVQGFLKSKVTKQMRIAFLSALICGILAHFVSLSNILNNYDSITQIPGGLGTGTTSGRWMISFIYDIQARFWYCYNTPFFNGIFVILVLAISACFVIKILKIDDPFHAFAVGAVMTVYPAVTSMLFFAYTAPVYSLSILMVVMSVWIADKKYYGSFVAVVLQVLSLAIYQAYLPLAAGLFLLKLIDDAFKKDSSPKTVILTAIKYFAILLISVCAYIITTKLIMNSLNRELNSYQGINEMGKISVSAIPQLIKGIYSNVFHLVDRNYCGTSATSVMHGVYRFLYLTIAVMLICFLLSKNYGFVQKMIGVVLCVIFPLAADSIEIMCANSYIYTLMVYGMICVLFLPIVLEKNSLQIGISMAGGKVKKSINVFCNVLISVALLLTVANYIWTSNVNNTALYYTDEQTQQYFASLTTRMRSAEDYEDGMKVAFINSEIEDDDFKYSWSGIKEIYGGNSFNYLNAYSRNNFIRQYVGYSFNSVSDEERELFSSKAEVQQMPSYPNDGSIKVIDGVLVVKLSESE